MEKYRNKIVEILIENGATKSESEILNDIDRDYWMEPDEAIAYGLADEILTAKTWAEWVGEVNE
jgi:ATP-dependent protease ClpP protease subunit